MNLNKINFKVSDPKLMNFIKSSSKKHNIPMNKFINYCIQKCMENEAYNKVLDEINNKICNVNNLYKLVSLSNEKTIKYLSSVFTASSILLQGKINEYHFAKLDPYKYYVLNLRELAEHFDLPAKLDLEDFE